MGAQKPDALIPNVPLRYAFENTSAENLLLASPRPQGALTETELPGKGRELSIFPVLAQQVQRVGLQAGNIAAADAQKLGGLELGQGRLARQAEPFPKKRTQNRIKKLNKMQR